MFSSSGSTSESRIGPPERKSLNARCSRVDSSGHVEAHPEVAGRVELLHPLMSGTAWRGGEVVAVGAREGLGVALEERARALLAELLEQGVAEVVAPGARRRGEARLDLGDVELRDSARLACRSR